MCIPSVSSFASLTWLLATKAVVPVLVSCSAGFAWYRNSNATKSDTAQSGAGRR